MELFHFRFDIIAAILEPRRQKEIFAQQRNDIKMIFFVGGLVGKMVWQG